MSLIIQELIALMDLQEPTIRIPGAILLQIVVKLPWRTSLIKSNIEIIRNRIPQLYEQKDQAHKAKDYPACLMIYGAIIELEKLEKEMERNEVHNSTQK